MIFNFLSQFPRLVFQGFHGCQCCVQALSSPGSPLWPPYGAVAWSDSAAAGVLDQRFLGAVANQPLNQPGYTLVMWDFWLLTLVCPWIFAAWWEKLNKSIYIVHSGSSFWYKISRTHSQKGYFHMLAHLNGWLACAKRYFLHVWLVWPPFIEHPNNNNWWLKLFHHSHFLGMASSIRLLGSPALTGHYWKPRCGSKSEWRKQQNLGFFVPEKALKKMVMYVDVYNQQTRL